MREGESEKCVQGKMTFFVNTWRISILGRAGLCVCGYAMKVGQALGPLCEPVCYLEERKKGGKNKT